MLSLHMIFHLSPFFSLLLCAASSAQSTGGAFLELHRWDGGGRDFHGWSVANAGDVNADGFDDVIANAGKYDGTVHVYSGIDGSLLHEWVHATDGTFGYSVDTAGDVDRDGHDDLVIGSRNIDTAWVFSGATGVLLFEFDHGPGGQGFARFVSTAGDVNGDGYSDLLIGATAEDPSGMSGAGSAFVFSGIDGSLLFRWDGAAAGDAFGLVSDAGDINLDGFDDVIIGAVGHDSASHSNAGAAYVFSGKDGSELFSWVGVIGSGYFGRVSDAGDLNADGIPDLVVGAPGPDPHSQSHRGTAYAYSGADGSLLYSWIGDHRGSWFGRETCGVGDVNGDGFGDVLIGAPWSAPFGMGDAGAVYLYSGADGGRLQAFAGESSSDLFGWSVSGGGDVNGDGLTDLIVGAEWALGQRGSTYVYGFTPCLSASSNEISVSTGGRIEFDLAFPIAAAGRPYRLLASASGTGPVVHGVPIPLTPDQLLKRTWQGNYDRVAAGGHHGVLDLNGRAMAVVGTVAGNWMDRAGFSYHVAAVVLDASGVPMYSSVAIPVGFVP